MKKDVYIFDTLLRDGEQGENISFSLADKIEIAKKLDEFGIDYIEGGWPGSNPKAVAFFKEMKNIPLKHAKLCAFGSTRRAKNKAEEDPNLLALIDSETPAVSIFGKSWDLHVTEALKITLDENLKLIYDSVKFLKSKNREVIFDAEHFFDGYKENPDYAIKTLEVAVDAGADVLSLCDTNGGSLPNEVYDITKKIVEKFPDIMVGIHAHNDGGMAVANSIMAVLAGARHVQGTINGFGERTGNADLCAIIPNINLKLKLIAIEPDKLKMLTKLSQFVYETANLPPDNKQPFVGKSAFAHKGGIHVSAVQRNARTYEHIPPEVVGNQRRILISELSGRSNFIARASTFKVTELKTDEEIKKVLKEVKELENKGYHFEVAEASLEILAKKILGDHKDFFTIEGFRVFVGKQTGERSITEATVKLRVGNEYEHTAGEGDGPVDALNNAMRKAVENFYPVIKEVRLVDYKVRVLNNEKGTAAKVRVLITSTDGKDQWITIGVSENLIEASYRALVDSIEYKLFLEEKKK